ncbi:MAG TPA: C40 family peptidase, partial [Chloroflexota bacterium]
IVDFNEGLENVDLIQPGQKLIIPGAKPLPPPTPTPVPPPTPKPPPPKPAPPTPTPQPEPEPEVQTAAAPPPPAEEPPPPPAEEPPPAPSGGRGDAVANFAMKYLGYPYVWGAAGPRAFDCSGFVYYVYRQNGVPISRGLWGQLESGQRVSRDALQPGDIVFFQNTYMAGLSHNGIYLGGGQFIHAVDPSQGVKISSLNDPYWASRWFGASRP